MGDDAVHWFILNDKKEVLPVKDIRQWEKWFTQIDNRIIARSRVTTNVLVSTVFLGIDHNWGLPGSPPGSPPELFETLVFGGPLDGEMIRYSTYNEAELGHLRETERVKKSIWQRLRKRKGKSK